MEVKEKRKRKRHPHRMPRKDKQVKRMIYIKIFLVLWLAAAVICGVLAAKECMAMGRSAAIELPDPDDMEELEEIPDPETLDIYQMSQEGLHLEEYFDSLDLLALCVMAEAEGESELGKRLVVDTILNRIAHPDFPDSIRDVIEYPGAFTSFTNGRIDRVEPTEEIFRLVAEELDKQTNEEVLYFTAGDWPAYGEPLLQEGAHYFSGE